MKIILVLISLLFSYVIVAQTDAETSKNSKPSWSSKLPDRNDAPELDAEPVDDTGLSGLEMDRSSLFDDDTEIVADDNFDATPIEENEKTQVLERQAEAAKIAEQERQAEAAKIAEQERQANIIRAAEQEKQTEADRIANQDKIAEDRKRAAEKWELEQKNTAQNQVSKTEEIQDTASNTYNWKKIKNSLPEYPTKAARDGKEGWVDVEFTINNSGTVIGAHPVKTYKNSKLFNKAALRAVRQWKYDPPSKYGIKLNLTKTVRIVFNLSE